MANWTENDLKKQFERAKNTGLIGQFKKSAAEYEFPPELLMAIASRETNIRNIVGDGGHGYGLMQIDDRSFPDWCHSGLWKNPVAAVHKGALVLDGKREEIRQGEGKRLSVGGNSFTGASLTKAQLLQTATAAYNCGLWAYCTMSKNGDPDQHATGKDYSADTYARAKIFARLL